MWRRNSCTPGITYGLPKLGFMTPSPPPRINNSPTLYFGDVGSFDDVSCFHQNSAGLLLD